MVCEILIDKKKYFFDGDTLQLYEDEIFYEEVEGEKEEKNKKVLSKITIVVSDMCNGKCVYCYETPGKTMLNKANANKIVDFLKESYNVIESVQFFGGEPLLNFQIIQYLVKKLLKEFSIGNFEITTNAVLLTDEMLRFFEKNNFKINISIDGPDWIHNKLRIGCAHEKVLDAIKKVKSMKNSNLLEVNCTYTKYHAENIELGELEDYFNKLGVKYNITKVITNIEWLALTDNSKEDAKKSIKLFYKRMLGDSLNKTTNVYAHAVIRAIVEHKYSGVFCQELLSGFAFDVEGDIYPCTRLIGKCKINDTKLQEYNQKNSRNCLSCWARGICSNCTAGIYLGEVEEKYSEECVKKELYEYALYELLSYLYYKPNDFQKIIDNFYK